MATNEEVVITFKAQNQTGAALKQTVDGLKAIEDRAKLASQGMAAIGLAAGGLAATIGLLGVGALQTGANFEQLQSALNNAFGSAAKGASEFERIQQFATATPFQVDALTASFLKLVNRGFVPTNEELTKIGDLASSQAKDFDLLVEAILDAQSGEFERLKEFGIQASKSGDEVTIAFRGANQTIQNTPEAIRNAIIEFGALQGIEGSLASQSATLAGQFSNLQDNVDQVALAFSNFAGGGAKAVIGAANTLVGTFLSLPAPIQQALFAVTGFAAVLGAAIAALAAYNAAVASQQFAALAAAAATLKNGAATVLLTAQTTAATIAQTTFALATGQATAAQLASASAFASTAIKAGLFAGAIAAVALAFDSLTAADRATAQTSQSIRDLEGAISSLKEAQANLGTEGAQSIQQLTDALELNRQAIEENIGGVQRFLDGIRGSLGITTQYTNAVNLQSIKFNDLVQIIDRDVLTAFDNLKAAPGGLAAASKEELDGLKASVEASIAALEAERPVTAEATAARNIYLESLRRTQAELEGVTAATVENTEMTKAQLDELRKAASEELSTQNADQERALSRQLQDEKAARDEQLAERLAAIQEQQQQTLGDLQERQQTELQAQQSAFDDAQAAKQEANQLKLQATEEAFTNKQNIAQVEFQAKETQITDAQKAVLDERQKAVDRELELAKLRDTQAQADNARLTEEERKLNQQIELATAQALGQDTTDLQAQQEQQDREADARAQAEAQFAEQRRALDEERFRVQAEQETRLAALREQLEAPIKAQQLADEQAAQARAAAFEKQQQGERTAFEQTVLNPLRKQLETELEAQKLAFEQTVLKPLREQQERELTDLRKAQEQELSDIRKANDLAEQALDRQYEDEKIARDRAFKDEQRALDLANAEQIAQILTEAGLSIPTPTAQPTPVAGSRRAGGTVEAGQLYQVHADEFFIPQTRGTILNQRDSRALVQQSLSRAAAPVASVSGGSDPALLREIRAMRGELSALRQSGRPNQNIVMPPDDVQSQRRLHEFARAAARYSR